MCLQLREALTTNRITLSKQFFSSTGIAEAKQQLESEMRFFSVITEAPKTPFGKVSCTHNVCIQAIVIVSLSLCRTP